MTVQAFNVQAWLNEAVQGLAGTGWQEDVQAFFAEATGRLLIERLQARADAGAALLPSDPFLALRLTPLHAVRVVILGQDPYHGEGQANGLAFSVNEGVAVPPSLRNIFKELKLWGPERKMDGALHGWAQQGVLLLNTVLTVELHQPAAHAGWGWEVLTDRLIKRCAAGEPAAYLLWGAHAQKKAPLLQGKENFLLESSHPSPLSANRGIVSFFGSDAFRKINDWLIGRGQNQIDWRKTKNLPEVQ